MAFLQEDAVLLTGAVAQRLHSNSPARSYQSERPTNEATATATIATVSGMSHSAILKRIQQPASPRPQVGTEHGGSSPLSERSNTSGSNGVAVRHIDSSPMRRVSHASERPAAAAAAAAASSQATNGHGVSHCRVTGGLQGLSDGFRVGAESPVSGWATEEPAAGSHHYSGGAPSPVRPGNTVAAAGPAATMAQLYGNSAPQGMPHITSHRVAHLGQVRARLSSGILICLILYSFCS